MQEEVTLLAPDKSACGRGHGRSQTWGVDAEFGYLETPSH